MRLRFQQFGGTGMAATWGQLFCKQGCEYLMIDGTCHFYAYLGGEPLEQWNPVVTGMLDPGAMEDLATDLDLASWPSGGGYISLEDPAGCPGTDPVGWLFTIGDSVSGCGCCTADALDLVVRSQDAVRTIYPSGEPYESPVVEAMVFAGDYWYSYGDWPGFFSVPWGASDPPETFVSQPYLGFGYYGGGAVVSDEDRPWFQETMTDFQNREMTGYSNFQDAIWVSDDPNPSFPDWELFIHPVVP